MPRTHKKISGCGISVNYKANKNRDFAKKKKAYTHHVNRNHNKNTDEITFENFNCKIKKLRSGSLYGNDSNISNIHGKSIDDVALYRDYDYKWNKKDKTLIDTINSIIEYKKVKDEDLRGRHIKNYYDEDMKFLESSKKQIERRGKVGKFYGHMRDTII